MSKFLDEMDKKLVSNGSIVNYMALVQGYESIKVIYSVENSVKAEIQPTAGLKTITNKQTQKKLIIVILSG